ncbi:MAG: MAPEG family protein [Pseudomonadota bacterium]
MAIELKLLGASVLLGLLYIVIAVGLATKVRGLQWNAGNRDGDVKPLTGAAGRAQRASSNFLETYPLFVAAVLAVVLAGKTSAYTALGVQLYFWARFIYLPVYIMGITYVRTVVWVVSVIGLLLVAWGLF